MSTGGEATRSAVRQGERWNAIAFAVIGVCGVAMNLAIARFFTPEDLGVFNTLLAVYIVGGQLGALGVQHSVLYHVPVRIARSEPTGQVFAVGVLIAAVISAVLIACLFITRDLLGRWLEAPSLPRAILLALPGLWLFPINKVLLAYLNGSGRAKAFAIGNASRYALIVAWIGLCVVWRWSGDFLCASLSFAEAVLVLGLFGAIGIQAFTDRSSDEGRQWVRRHLSFGLRVLPAGVVSELNSRIDVLVLGVMVNVEAVGIYSIASIFAEGLYQMVLVLRFSFDPTIATLVADARWQELRQLVRRGQRLGYGAAVVVGGIAVALYPLLLPIALGKSDFDASWPVFSVLATGIAIAAGFIPMSGLLQQAGRPGAQSLLFTLIAATNLIANVFLIAAFGTLGAAIATAIAQISLIPFLKLLSRQQIGFAP